MKLEVKPQPIYRGFLFRKIMIDEQQVALLLQHFSLITVGQNKKPNFAWKKYQTEKATLDEFLKHYHYKGGIIKTDGEALPPTTGVGIVTGFDFLECVDIDTKVFSTQIEKDEFWNEYITTLKENIVDFDKKFGLFQTVSGGYHIIYRSKRVEGNQKIAKLKGHKEALIESRGIGGYIFIYPQNQIGSLSYFKLQFITDRDRDTLWTFSKAYDYQEKLPEQPKRDKKIYQEGEITPWDDFNQRNTVWDVVQEDFIIPRNGIKSRFTIVKRHGATSEHSGYIYNDNGCLFLHSTGTIYPAEEQLTAFACYAWKYHNGNFSQATKDLYEQGFGSRLKVKIEENKPNITQFEPVKDVEFPLDIFSKDFQYYMTECNKKLHASLDYMGCALLWVASICIGNSVVVEVKKGWIEKAIIWLSLVGKAGIGKTPAINNIIFPLEKLNFKEIKQYYQQMEQYEHFQSLTKKEKEQYPEQQKPRKSQFIANDITLEALVDLHQETDNAVGVFKDELAGWLKDMNKYRAGSDLEFWLSCWSGKSVALNRITRKGSFVERPFISVLGGIQPTILNELSTESNKENGFLDRLLMAFPNEQVQMYNEAELHPSDIKWYSDNIISIYQSIKQTFGKQEEPQVARFSQEAKAEWVRIFNEITTIQNDENDNEYLKSMYPKQKSYIPRFALLIHFLKSSSEDGVPLLIIDKDSILKAEKLSKYFVSQAKKIHIESYTANEMKTIARKGDTVADKVKILWESDKDFNKAKAAELFQVTRQHIYKIVKDLESKHNV